MSGFCQLWLTCATKPEADSIAKILLKKHLVACVKQLPVGSDFLWKGKVDHNDEVLLLMDSHEALFDEVEAEVMKLHSYETFVLQAVAVAHTSKAAAGWLTKSLKKL